MTAADRLEPDRERQFRYGAVSRDGRRVRDVVRARDEPAALRRLMAQGLTVTELAEVSFERRADENRSLRSGERVLIVRQLALMLEAGVSLLEALETVTIGVAARTGRRQFEAVITALKRGDPLAKALRAHAPGFPDYAYAMAEVGEASGRTPELLRAAGEQMAYEHRLSRDLVNALTYPALLACAGAIAVGFIFVEIVPRFSALIGAGGGSLPMLSRIVFQVGGYVDGHPALVGAGLLALIAGVVAAAGLPAARRGVYALGRGLPVAGQMLQTREIAGWSRLIALALTGGVALLDAAVLARRGLPDGPFRHGLEAVEVDLRAGVALHVALGRHTRLTAMDLSLVRTGQASSALDVMFGFLADSYDDRLKDAMKRFTALAEPLAIGVISLLVGVIALALVMALASIYDAVQ